MPKKNFRWRSLLPYRRSKEPKVENGIRQDGSVGSPLAVSESPPTTTNASKTTSSISIPIRAAASFPEYPVTSVRHPTSADLSLQFTKDATSGQKGVASTDPELLWDEAYDDLKRDEPKLLKYYEELLSRDLGDSQKGTANGIEQTDRAKRRSQMDGLLHRGLEKTAQLTEIENNIGVAVDVVLSVKETIGTALQAVPIAALAWTGICVALQASLSSLVNYIRSSCHRSLQILFMRRQ